MYCTKCNQDKEFFIRNNKSVFSICKDCVKDQIDDFNLANVLLYCQIGDIPFIENEFFKRRKKAYLNGDYNSNKHFTVFGQYLNTMKLPSFKNYRWEDTSFLNISYLQYSIREEARAAHERTIT